jgi:uncharacterized RDD family membrane protein YckC
VSHVEPGTAPVHHDVDPVPREARGIQGLAAGIVTRTAANTVDFLSMTCVLTAGYAAWFAMRFLIRPVHFTAPSPPFVVVLVCAGTVLVVYFTVSWATTGRTYGDHLLGLRVVDSRGRRLRWRAALVRAVLCVGFPIGLFWAVVSVTGRSLQDTVLRTRVVYDWAVRGPGSAPIGTGDLLSAQPPGSSPPEEGTTRRPT